MSGMLSHGGRGKRSKDSQQLKYGKNGWGKVEKGGGVLTTKFSRLNGMVALRWLSKS